MAESVEQIQSLSHTRLRSISTESGVAWWGDNIMLTVSGRAGEYVCRYQTINNHKFTPVSPILAACYI